MNPIMERISSQPKVWLERGNAAVNPYLVKLDDRRKEVIERGNAILAELQERQQRLRDTSTRAAHSFEEIVLNRVAGLLRWAHHTTGKRSSVLRRTIEFVEERIGEVHKLNQDELAFAVGAAAEAVEAELNGASQAVTEFVHEVIPAEVTPAEVIPAEVVPEEGVTLTSEPVVAEVQEELSLDEEALPEPFEGYDKLTARKIIARFSDETDVELLEHTYAYELGRKNRKTVLKAISERLEEMAS